jgi:hypothetical protein
VAGDKSSQEKINDLNLKLITRFLKYNAPRSKAERDHFTVILSLVLIHKLGRLGVRVYPRPKNQLVEDPL